MQITNYFASLFSTQISDGDVININPLCGFLCGISPQYLIKATLYIYCSKPSTYKLCYSLITISMELSTHIDYLLQLIKSNTYDMAAVLHDKNVLRIITSGIPYRVGEVD